jgi:hypothetical protein
LINIILASNLLRILTLDFKTSLDVYFLIVSILPQYRA